MRRSITAQTLVFFLVVLFFWKIRGYSQISIFQERDLFRAGQFAQGKFFLYGPELSGGGNLPGPFYYGLLGLAQAVRAGWRSVYALLIGLHALGIALAFGFFLRRFGAFAAWVFLGVCFLSRFIHDQVMFFWNPSFLPFLSFVYLIFCEQIYYERRWSIRFRLLLFFFCGLTVQFHSLGIIFFLHAILDAQWLRRRPWKEALVNTGIFLLPNMPFLASLAVSPGHHSADFAGVLTYLQRYLDPSGGDAEFLKRWPLRISVLAALLALPAFRKSSFFRSYALFFLFALVPAVVALRENYAGRYGAIVAAAAVVFATAGLLRMKNWVAVAILIAAFVAEGFEVIGHSSYLVLLRDELGPALVLTMAALIAALRLTGWRWRRCLISVAAFSCLFVMVSTSIRVHSIRHHRVPINGNEFIARKIYESTGWSFEEAERRIFFVNFRHDFGLYYSYLEAARGASRRAGHPLFDGFFAVDLKKDGFPYSEAERPILAAAVKPILQKNRIERTLAAAIRAGELELLDGRLGYGVAVIPYRVKPGSVAPTSFHNYGRTYLSKPFDPESGDIRASYRFLVHECPAREADCDILVGISLDQDGSASRRTGAAVLIDGMPISQAHFALSPDWAETWISPYLLFRCGSGPLRRREIAGRIGSLAEEEFAAYHGMTSNFLAPYAHRLLLDCPKDEVREIGFGYESAFVKSYKTGRGKVLAGREFLRSTGEAN